MAERNLTRKELGKRYGVARNTIYNWVQYGVLPDADVHYSNQFRWSEGRLAKWERRHLAALARQGVDIDHLPQFRALTAEKGATRKVRGRGASKQAEDSGAAAEAFAVLAKARALLIGTLAKNKQLAGRERKAAVDCLKQVIALLGK